MNTEKMIGKNEQSAVNKNKSQEKPWELSKEDSSFFKRKFKALKFFRDKLYGTKEESSNFSAEAVSKLDEKVADLKLDSLNPEEIKAIKEQVDNLERQKQEALNLGEKGIEKIDAEISKQPLSEEDQAFFDRKFKARDEFSGKLNNNKKPLENSNTENSSIEDKEKTDNTVLTKKPEDNQLSDEEKVIENSQDSIEKQGEKPLEPGDEIYSNGNFYKVYDIRNLTAEEERQKWKDGELDRDKEFKEKTGLLPYKEGSDNFFKEREKFEELKKKELKENGPKITAIIEGGEEKIEIDSRNIQKITSSEQREKIVKMQKDEDRAESRAADYMGMGATKKYVDKITGQPGKF